MNEGDQDEVERLKRIIDALMDRAERSGIIQGADIDLFRTAVLLEEELERRKEELAEALAENEKI
ncbi:MAG: ATP-binding protein, partial [Burkholderiales bacterium]|nr:ATP-binding protein [Burkholderiales bacterium]